jgi:hypothetical protein
MNQLEKLQVLLPHWIEHNEGHAEECRKWTDDVENTEVKTSLDAALEAMETVSNNLTKALEAAGGAKTGSSHGHHHHHHHE